MEEIIKQLKDLGAPAWFLAMVLVSLGAFPPLARAWRTAKEASQQELIGKAWSNIVAERKKESEENRKRIEALEGTNRQLLSRDRDRMREIRELRAKESACQVDLKNIRVELTSVREIIATYIQKGV